MKWEIVLGWLDSLILNLLNFLLNVAQLVVRASIVISWFQVSHSNQVVSMIIKVTEPVYAYFRKWTSNIPGPIDWAPAIVILILMFAQNLVRRGLQSGFQ